MKHPAIQQIGSKSLNSSTNQEEVHQQTLDYLEKELKDVQIANQPQSDKLKMTTYEKITPLRFKLAVGSHGFLISYKHNQFSSSIIKIIVLIVVAALMTFPLFYYTQINKDFRAMLISLLYSVPALYMLLFFLDPGTVFDDEEQNFREERVYCMTCHIYRNLSTKHCSFCNKCCKRYDHHCSVFGKCIGKRNILIFYLFIICTSLTLIVYFIASIEELFGEFNQKPNQQSR